MRYSGAINSLRSHSIVRATNYIATMANSMRHKLVAPLEKFPGRIYARKHIRFQPFRHAQKRNSTLEAGEREEIHKRPRVLCGPSSRYMYKTATCRARRSRTLPEFLGRKKARPSEVPANGPSVTARSRRGPSRSPRKQRPPIPIPAFFLLLP